MTHVAVRLETVQNFDWIPISKRHKGEKIVFGDVHYYIDF